MTREQIENKIISFMTKNFELEEGSVTVASKFEKDLELDSLDAVELGLHLEELTDKEVSEAQLRKVVTVGDAVELVIQLNSETTTAAKKDSEAG